MQPDIDTILGVSSIQGYELSFGFPQEPALMFWVIYKMVPIHSHGTRGTYLGVVIRMSPIHVIQVSCLGDLQNVL